MNQAEALATLRRHEEDLRARGIRHAAIFGSVVRGSAGPGGDLDIMIDIEPEAPMTIFDYVGLKEYVAALFEGQVDVVSREGLKPDVRAIAATEAIYAF
jgi:predicted nucleotidyltransferase